MENNKRITISKTIAVLSILYSFFIIFGFSFWLKDSWNLIIGALFNSIASVVIFIGLAIGIYFFLTWLFHKLNFYSSNYRKEVVGVIGFKNRYLRKIVELHDRYPFRFSLVIMILAWLPYIIAYYPILLNPDSSYQIKQFFGITNLYDLFSDLIDKNVVITNHHPIIHTLLLGFSLKFGHFLWDDNFGLFLYSVIQILVLSSSLSYSIKYLKKNGVGKKYRLAMLFIYSFLPIYPFYSMTGVKDIIFSAFIVFYIIFLHKILFSEGKLKSVTVVTAFIVMVLVILFRNNGFHVVFLSFPFLILLKKDNRKQLTLVFGVVVILAFFYSKAVLPFFKITPSSIRESLSIPFQQTARYVKYYGEDVTLKEQGIIDILLDYGSLADRYKPEISDPVKNSFNRFYEKDDLEDYFKVWLAQFLKHPGVYIEATMNNAYGYFFPLKVNWYIYHNFNPSITDDGFNYSFNNLGLLRDILYYPSVILQYIPIVGLSVNIGFHVWLLIFMGGYLIYRGKYKGLVILAPATVLVLVCVASPVNAYYRYALPYIFTMPLMIGLFNGIIKEKRGKYKGS